MKTEKEITTDSTVLAEMFNSHCINFVQETSGKKPSHFGCENKISDTTQAIEIVIQLHSGHTSISRKGFLQT